MRSDDGGRTWRVQNNGMPQTAATHILRDPSGALYVTGFGRGVFKSTDGGEHLVAEEFRHRRRAALCLAHGARVGRRALPDRGAAHAMTASFGNAGDGALYRSTDGAEHWSRVPLPAGLNGPNGLAIDPRDPARLYLGARGAAAPAKAPPMEASISPPTAAPSLAPRTRTGPAHL